MTRDATVARATATTEKASDPLTSLSVGSMPARSEDGANRAVTPCTRTAMPRLTRSVRRAVLGTKTARPTDPMNTNRTGIVYCWIGTSEAADSAESGQPTRTMTASMRPRIARVTGLRRSTSQAAPHRTPTRRVRARVTAGGWAWNPRKPAISPKTRKTAMMMKPTFAQMARRSW